MMMAERYLTENGLARALEQGRAVEHWLGARTEGRVTVLKWLSIEPDSEDHAVLCIREVLDDGGPEFLDVYEFTPYDAEAEHGVEIPFASAQEALRYSLANLGADPGKFVNEGIVQDEYADYLKSRK